MTERTNCPFCNGQGVTVNFTNCNSVDLYHWCRDDDELPKITVRITARTKEECDEVWNKCLRTGPSCSY